MIVMREQRTDVNLKRLAKLGKVVTVKPSTFNKSFAQLMRLKEKDVRELGSGCFASVFANVNDAGFVYKVLWHFDLEPNWNSWDRKNMDGYIMYLRRIAGTGSEHSMFPRIHGFKVYCNEKTGDCKAIIRMERLEPLCRDSGDLQSLIDEEGFQRVKGAFKVTKIYRDLTHRFGYCDDLHRANVMKRINRDNSVDYVITDPFC